MSDIEGQSSFINGKVRALRPWINNNERCFIKVNQGGNLVDSVPNVPATLRYEEWQKIDQK